MELSVIIPVYNVEQWLQKCVESVVSQGIGSCEIILVDDGSPDQSGSICDRLARSYDNIVVLHKQNGGLSDARNAGLEVARGRYVTFVDSDDTLSPGLFGQLLGILREDGETDILEYSFVQTDQHGSQQPFVLPDATYHDMNSYWLDGQAYRHAYAWNKIYRRSLFADVRFPLATAFEDIHTLPHLLSRCKKVRTTSVGSYCYAYNPSGITANAGAKELTDLLNAHVSFLRNHLQGIDTTDKKFAAYYTSALNVQIDVASATGQQPSLPMLKLRPANWKLLILNTFGFNTLCKISHLAKALRPQHR